MPFENSYFSEVKTENVKVEPSEVGAIVGIEVGATVGEQGSEVGEQGHQLGATVGEEVAGEFQHQQLPKKRSQVKVACGNLFLSIRSSP